MSRPLVYGPTYAEMRDPQLIDPALRTRARVARDAAPLAEENLFTLGWRDLTGRVPHRVLPPALTGVAAPIVVVSGKRFPTGSHKVGAAYAILMEKQLDGHVLAGVHTLVCPSTGNFGIGMAWVGGRMGYRTVTVVSEDVEAQRYEKIRAFGGDVELAPGTGGDLKRLLDRVRVLAAEPPNIAVDQYSEFGNYRFHYEVTGNAIIDLAQDLGARGVGDGTVRAFVAAVGSGGTLAAADRLRQKFSGLATVGLEPLQCSTFYNLGFGPHLIDGIGHRHVAWIHNVRAMDYVMCIDDVECLRGLQLLQEGTEALIAEGVPEVDARGFGNFFGVSGVCNILGAIRTARLLNLGPRDTVVTVATDGFDRYSSALVRLTRERGPMDQDEARRRLGIFRSAPAACVLEGRPAVRERWLNQKYLTWVELRGRSEEELRAQASEEFWLREQARVAEYDRRQREAREGAAIPREE
jgi:cysteine synthase